MTSLEVFDPPMCCSTGVCGPTVDPALVRFSADLQWLAHQGIRVDRYNLGQQPQAFVANPLVKAALNREGNRCLPLILVNGSVAVQGSYPPREELAKLAGLSQSPQGLSPEAVTELVAIGAAVAAHCESSFRRHVERAKQLGVSNEDMMRAVRTAQTVEQTPAKAMLEMARRTLESAPAALPVLKTCCG